MDVALDDEFCHLVPNQRPELCPRLGTTLTSDSGTGSTFVEQQKQSSIKPNVVSTVLGFDSTRLVLTVGDGDLTYSLALVRIGCQVLATCLEEKDTLYDVYGYDTMEKTIRYITDLGSTVAFGVDAIELITTLPATYSDQKFDRIVWNFPCSAQAKGQDGQNKEMDMNKRLLRLFAANAIPLLTDNGQIHLNHKTKPPFNQWKIQDEIVGGSDGRLSYLGRIVLDRALFPPYIPRKALDRKSFPYHDACTYIFGKGDSNHKTTTALESCMDVVPSTDKISTTLFHPLNSLVLVTPELISTLRTNFMILHSRYDQRKQNHKKRSSLP